MGGRKAREESLALEVKIVEYVVGLGGMPEYGLINGRGLSILIQEENF